MSSMPGIPAFYNSATKETRVGLWSFERSQHITTIETMCCEKPFRGE